ncbi:MAG TPA: aldose 1-epimerase family protein [Devosiaceae bacterium]|nr:aldose 1-epimerase family protein [Devosiaceae bacterium]
MRIANSELTVEVASVGAELQSIVSANGAQWLWHGDPKWWPSRAPLLFPVVGESPEHAVTIEGKRYPMQRHGFTRHSTFEVASEHADRVTLMLKASPETRESYPFEFFLSVSYALEGKTLVTSVEVGNLDSRQMPFGFGFHPAFVWPLPGGEGKRHYLKLASRDTPKFLQLDGKGLILPEAYESPFVEGEMTLAPDLFSNDALIFPFGVGTGITFAAENGSSVALSWLNLPNFAVWQKRGAPYLCLEPWHGMAARAGAGDDISARPSTVTLAPNETAKFELRATFQGA